MPLHLHGAFLGLGSIVRLENDSVSGLFVVLARGTFRADSAGDEVLPRYLVGPHPFGEASDRETFPILSSEIREVVFEGYTDAADAAFLDDLLDQMENGRRAPAAPPRKFTGALTDLPAALPGGADDAGSAHADRDPFFALRELVDQEHRRSGQ